MQGCENWSLFLEHNGVWDTLMFGSVILECCCVRQIFSDKSLINSDCMINIPCQLDEEVNLCEQGMFDKYRSFHTMIPTWVIPFCEFQCVSLHTDWCLDNKVSMSQMLRHAVRGHKWMTWSIENFERVIQIQCVELSVELLESDKHKILKKIAICCLGTVICVSLHTEPSCCLKATKSCDICCRMLQQTPWVSRENSHAVVLSERNGFGEWIGNLIWEPIAWNTAWYSTCPRVTVTVAVCIVQNRRL